MPKHAGASYQLNNQKDYWEKRLQKHFGLDGTGFKGLGRNYNYWMYKVRKKIFLKKLRSVRIDFEDEQVLDIGVGTGFWIDAWKELGVKHISGLDITDISIQKMRIKYPNSEFYLADIGGELPKSLLEKKYDAISAVDMLFHIIDDEKYERAIKNIYSLLKPNGIFIFTDDFLHGATRRTETQVCRSIVEIENIILKNGFKIIERFPMFILMNRPIDSNSGFFYRCWNILQMFISVNETIGLVIGALLYPLETILIQIVNEGPSTEMMLCKKLVP